MFDGQVASLDLAVKAAAEKNENARLLMSQPGVGPVTSLAFVLTMGDVRRFPRGKQVASYLGLIPREYSSGGHQRLGSISKQGNRFMRMLLVEAAQVAVRCDPGLRKRVFASPPQQAERSGEGGGGEEVGDSTLLDAADAKAVSGDRSCREQPARCPWSARARPKD